MRNYLLGTTHRKDVLEGALWRRLRGQLASLDEDPIEDAMPADYVLREGAGLVLPYGPLPPHAETGAADAGAVLGAILRYTAGIMRWEPLNPNSEHRACPSPGNRFTVDVEIACRGDAGARRFRYLPREDALVRIDDRDDDECPTPNVVTIALRADLTRCASPYGDLAYCLATIELGATLAQLALVLGIAGFALETVRSVAHGNPTGGPVLVARLCAPAIAVWLGRARTMPMRFVDVMRPANEVVGGRLLRDLRRLVSRGVSAAHIFPRGLSADPSDVAGLTRATASRSSGLDLHGTSEGRPDVEQVAAMLDAACALHDAFAGIEALPVRLDVRMDKHLAESIEGDRSRAFASWLHVEHTRDHRPPGYPHPAGAVIVSVSADLRDYAARLAAGAVFGMHVAAGMATQIVGIAAAAAGLACRPMRSFDHAAADAALPIDCWSMIQLVVYADRMPNPAFAVSGASWAGRP